MPLPRTGKRSKRLPRGRWGSGLRTTVKALVSLKTERDGVSHARHKSPYSNTYQCRACGKHPAADPHHIVRKGAGGCDCAVNIIWLCRKCHDLLDHVGRNTFFTVTFPQLADRLEAALEHRNARNRRDSALPCASKSVRRIEPKVNVCYDGP